ncbi:MAG: SAM-dependent methyltransferase, partial [Firmicutes bacterium]|nr:SAM-dependent methyltransferase [Bacillota bacterium]
MIKLSKRMKAVASMVTPGNVLADVGTDHGYVPISLVQRKRIPRAIAMDINKGPLQRACEHIAEFQLEECIETRLSDGVKKLEVGEVDSILIAGMGGELVIHILTDGMEVCRSAKELILQPQSELEKVRQF